MDNVQVLERLHAARVGHAVRTTSLRHVHMVDNPLVVVPFHLAGAPGAPVAFMYGTRPDRGRLAVIPEPRNVDLRFSCMTPFATDFNAYMGRYMRLETKTGRRRGGETYTYPEAPEAPQIVVPNTATASWLTTELGRSLRYLRTSGSHPVDPALPRAGANLTFLSNQRTVPGSCLVLAATEALTMHWATPQMDIEDAALGTVLAWIDPPPGLTPMQAAVRSESEAPAGPISDPEWDNSVLAPVIDEFNRLRRAGVDPQTASQGVRNAIAQMIERPWADTWHALKVLRSIRHAAPSTLDRWAGDRRAWTKHVLRIQQGRAFFRRQPTALMSALTLQQAESADAELTRQMALDDPWVMARAVATGEAFEGEVVGVDLAHREHGPRRMVNRPLLRVRPYEPFLRPPGTLLYWAADTRVCVKVLSADAAEVQLMVVAGMRNGRLPRQGERVLFSPYGNGEWYGRALPNEIPWTHVLPNADAEDAE